MVMALSLTGGGKEPARGKLGDEVGDAFGGVSILRAYGLLYVAAVRCAGCVKHATDTPRG